MLCNKNFSTLQPPTFNRKRYINVHNYIALAEALAEWITQYIALAEALAEWITQYTWVYHAVTNL